MFGRIRKVISNIEEIKPEVILKTIISKQEVKDLILHLNRVEQLFKEGIDSDGDVIGTYGELTEFINRGQQFAFEGVTKRKLAGEPYLLYDSGFFYRSFQVRVYNDGFTITANDETEDGTELAIKFGKKIIGLTKQNTNEVVQKVKPIFEKEVRKQIFAK